MPVCVLCFGMLVVASFVKVRPCAGFPECELGDVIFLASQIEIWMVRKVGFLLENKKIY